MKKILLVLLLSVLIAGCNAENNKENSYSSIIEAIKKKDNITFVSTIKEISNVDSLIAVDSIHSYSLLGFACLYNNKEAVECLMGMKADPHIAYADDIYIYDALYIAIKTQNENLVRYFINKGSNVNAPYNENGLCPLVLSCYHTNTAIPELLLKNKAKVNGIGNLGGDLTYPLIIAIENGNKSLVKLLLDYGAKTNITDNAGYSPIEIAQEKGFNSIVTLLGQGNVKNEITSWIGKYTCQDEENTEYVLNVNKTGCLFEVIGMQVYYQLSCNTSYIEKNKITFDIKDILEGSILGEYSKKNFIELSKNKDNFILKINYGKGLIETLNIKRR